MAAIVMAGIEMGSTELALMWRVMIALNAIPKVTPALVFPAMVLTAQDWIVKGRLQCLIIFL